MKVRKQRYGTRRRGQTVLYSILRIRGLGGGVCKAVLRIAYVIAFALLGLWGGVCIGYCVCVLRIIRLGVGVCRSHIAYLRIAYRGASVHSI